MASPIEMPKLSRDSMMTLEAYAKARKDFRTQVIAHKKARTVHLGDHLTLLFDVSIEEDFGFAERRPASFSRTDRRRSLLVW